MGEPDAGVHGLAGGSPALVPEHGASLVAWQQWCASHAGHRCHLALSGQWLLTWLAASDVRRPDLVQARAQAVEHWAHYLGFDADAASGDWTIRLARLRGGVLVCAMPRALVDDVQAVAAHHGVDLAWMGPWWAPGMARWLQHRSARGADGVEGAEDGLHVLMAQEGGWVTQFEARRKGLLRVWAERAEPAPGQGPTLRLGPQGLSDDPITAALVRGLAPVWCAPMPEGAT